MSLKRNILANYASQIYVTLIGIVMVPMYVRYMGAEAYGLVGFFSMLQAWFQLLDMGLTPTMARETARFSGGKIDVLALRRLLRALEGVFVGIALVGSFAMIIGSRHIANGWLKVQHLPLFEVQHAVILMAVIVALRWVCGLYRGAINGFERLVWLSGFNSMISTARFVIVVPLFIYIGSTPTDYFTYQLIIAIVELIVLVAKTYTLLPKVDTKDRTPWQWQPLRGVLKFSLSIAFTSSVWVIVTQTDKLVLSKLLPLAEYAYFTLAVLVASGVMLISGPISGALLPRMTKLAAEGQDDALISLYRNATKLVGVIAIPAALVLAFFGEQVLWAWTGNAGISHTAAPVLRLYAVGNGILALAAFPYYLQFAKGDLRLHLYGNVLFLVLLLPALIWATIRFGVIGAGYAWLCANVTYFLFWVPKVHRRFVQGLHTKWMSEDIGRTICITSIAALLLRFFVTWPESRLYVALEVVVISITLLAIAAIGSGVAQHITRAVRDRRIARHG